MSARPSMRRCASPTRCRQRYLVGATLRYRYGNETQEMVLNPDSILVKPMPALTLDYFLRLSTTSRSWPSTSCWSAAMCRTRRSNNSLLIDFGDIAPNSAKMGRWVIESNLAGTFVEFDARFTHADELGGATARIRAAASPVTSASETQPTTAASTRDTIISVGTRPMATFPESPQNRYGGS
ncbi:hypothetical protein [Stenotrophomonas rhizophila]